jgi:hypothetical protein
MVTESHLPAVEPKTEASHLPERTIVGVVDGLLHRVAWGKS